MAASCSASDEELQYEELLWLIPRPWCINALLRMRVIAAVFDMDDVILAL